MFIAKYAFKCFFSKGKRILIFIFLSTLLIFSTGFLGNYLLNSKASIDSITIIITDNDNSMESGIFYNTLENLENYKEIFVFEKASLEQAKEKIKNNQADAVYVIPENFTEKIKNGDNIPFEVIYNGTSPIRTTLLKLYTKAFTELLKVSQANIYTGLDYVARNGTNKEYSDMYKKINLRFLGLILNRDALVETETIERRAGTDIFTHIVISIYVFIMFAGAVLWSNIITENFPFVIINSLKKQGTSYLKIIFSLILAILILFLIINLPILFLFYFLFTNIFNIAINFYFVLSILLFLICLSAFTVTIGFAFKNIFSSGIFVAIFSLISFIFSGGLIPLNYLPNVFSKTAMLTINFHSVNIIKESLFSHSYPSSLVGITIFFLSFILFSIIILKHDKKAGVHI